MRGSLQECLRRAWEVWQSGHKGRVSIWRKIGGEGYALTLSGGIPDADEFDDFKNFALVLDVEAAEIIEVVFWVMRQGLERAHNGTV